MSEQAARSAMLCAMFPMSTYDATVMQTTGATEMQTTSAGGDGAASSVRHEQGLLHACSMRVGEKEESF